METVGLGGRKAAGHSSDPVGSLVTFAVGEKNQQQDRNTLLLRILPFYDNIFISFLVGSLCNEGRDHNAFVGINSPMGLQSLGCCTHCRSAWLLLPWCLLGTGG